MLTRALILVACLPFFSSASFAQESPQALQDAFMAGLRANDADALARCYADDAVNFTVGEMRLEGPEAVRASWNDFFSRMRILKATLDDDHLEQHGATAIAWGLFHLVAEPVDGGEQVDIQGRFMDVARKIDGRWLYVADHASLPVVDTAAEPGAESG